MEVSAPSPLLKGGLAFIDTPGRRRARPAAPVGHPGPAARRRRDADDQRHQPGVHRARDDGSSARPTKSARSAAIVATKTDLYPYWREIVAANTAHLQRAGLALPMIPASSLLRSHAIAAQRQGTQRGVELPGDRQVPLREGAVPGERPDARPGARRNPFGCRASDAGGGLRTVGAQRSRRGRDRLTDDLERRKQEAQDALQQTALWQQVLNDGIADLTADVDHDLRARFRAITQHTEQVIDACDPTQHWAEIGAELENAVATAVGDNFVWAYQRAEALAAGGRPARSSRPAWTRSRCRRSSAREMGAGFGELKSLARLEAKPIKAGPQGGHRHARLLRRRADVRHADVVRRAGHVQPAVAGRRVFCWAARPTRRTWRTGCCGCATRRRRTCAGSSTTSSFVVSKESRDRLKGIQRQLRDHYRGIANQTTRSLNESLQATLTAAKLEENERNNRVAELERQLNILGQVIDHANKLAAADRSRRPSPWADLARRTPSAVLRPGE